MDEGEGSFCQLHSYIVRTLSLIHIFDDDFIRRDAPRMIKCQFVMPENAELISLTFANEYVKPCYDSS